MRASNVSLPCDDVFARAIELVASGCGAEAVIRREMAELSRVGADRMSEADALRYRYCWRELALRMSSARRPHLSDDFAEVLRERARIRRDIDGERARIEIESVFGGVLEDGSAAAGTGGHVS